MCLQKFYHNRQTDSAAQDGLEGDQKDLAATFATLDSIGEYNTACMQRESGAVDAVACDLSIAQYQLAAKPDAYTQLDEPLSSEHYAVGFKKGDTKSADAVTESLKAAGFTVLQDYFLAGEHSNTFRNWERILRFFTENRVSRSDVVVALGGGVVGGAIARELSRYRLRIAVLEKESDVCT